jgi:hypothetical protein
MGTAGALIEERDYLIAAAGRGRPRIGRDARQSLSASPTFTFSCSRRMKRSASDAS